MKPVLKAPRSMLLKLRYYGPLSNFAFDFNLRRYHLAPGGACSCKGSNPLPVALPGFCRAQYSWDCFIQCPGGASQCPGWGRDGA